jgi:hypothetical protein
MVYVVCPLPKLSVAIKRRVPIATASLSLNTSNRKVMDNTTIVAFLILTCTLVVFCQEDPLTGTCSNAVIVMTKEEMKREIQTQIADAFANSAAGNSNGNCSSEGDDVSKFNQVIAKLEEVSNNLAAIRNKLINLHQPGVTASHPATSCKEIYDFNPNITSGYYWLRSANGSAVRVFCDMTLTCKGVGGGWMQVAKLDMTNSSHQCPLGTKFMNTQSKRLCGKDSSQKGCSSTTFAIQGIEYNRVCGKIIAYQYATPDSFRDIHRSGTTINDDYVDGISLTYGNPRTHIWTFAAASNERYATAYYSCPCTNIHNSGSAAQPPSFVGTDYFCDTAPAEALQLRLYPDDPLWDGAGCGPANTCCSLNNPPWFLKQLPSTTTGNIEMRICRDEGSTNEDILVETIDLFIQ